MISIRKSLGDLERIETLRQLAYDGYLNAIRSTADYVIELDPALAGEFRQHLQQMREQLEAATEPEEYQAVQASLRGELRLYRDQSAEWLERLQRDLKSAAMAMETVAASVTSNGVDHEKRMQADLGSLTSIEANNDLPYIRRVVHDAVASIAESWEQLRRANQVVIAQLRDEIQALHREIDNERRALFTDAPSGAWNRQKINMRIEDNLSRREAFCLVMASITNLKRLSATHSGAVIDGALKALVKRIHGIVGRDAMVARWSEDEFAILLELEPKHAMAISGEIATELSSRYSIQEHGVARSLSLRINTSTVDRPAGGDSGKFREKLAAIGSSRK